MKDHLSIKKWPVWILLLLSAAQYSLQAQSDSLDMLTFDAFMDRVGQHHPLVTQAELLPEMGDARVLSSRGAFDPKLQAGIDQKYFEQSQYFSHLNGGLKIPTWFGIELEAAYRQNQGRFLNPEHKTPLRGLWSAGISLPLGQNLFIDERRAELRKARIYRESSEAEKQVLLNELYYEAGVSYWNWFKAYYKMDVYQNALRIAEERLQIVKRESRIGERPGIDSVEAGIQYQNRLLQLQSARMEFMNQTALLSIFMWEEGLIPLELDTTVLPQPKNDVQSETVDQNVLTALNELPARHPMLQQQRFKIDQLSIDQQFKAEQLKPTLNLGYKPLASAGGGEDILSSYDLNDYIWELGFSSPLFLRKERGDLKMSQLKVTEARLDLSNKEQVLEYKAKAAINKWRVSLDQIQLYRQTVRDYERLLEGERRLFEGGESSLFMVNARESNYISAQLQLIELLANNQKAILETRYALGNLNF